MFLFRLLIHGRWSWIIHVKFLGRARPCVDFYPTDYSVPERRGAVIERADSTISAFQKILECKQLMPDKTVVVLLHYDWWHAATSLRRIKVLSVTVLQPCLILALKTVSVLRMLNTTVLNSKLRHVIFRFSGPLKHEINFWDFPVMGQVFASKQILCGLLSSSSEGKVSIK